MPFFKLSLVAKQQLFSCMTKFLASLNAAQIRFLSYTRDMIHPMHCVLLNFNSRVMPFATQFWRKCLTPCTLSNIFRLNQRCMTPYINEVRARWIKRAKYSLLHSHQPQRAHATWYALAWIALMSASTNKASEYVHWKFSAFSSDKFLNIVVLG
jgi:hypothetical protein